MLHEDLTDRIIGCAITVHRVLGPGLSESMYQNALSVEMTAQGLKYVREAMLDVAYRHVDIGDLHADFIVQNLVVVELKATQEFTLSDHRQGTNCLKYSKFEVELLLAFGGPRLKINRKDFGNDLKERIQAGASSESLWMLLEGRQLPLVEPGASKKTA